jgi:hypothetical protein
MATSIDHLVPEARSFWIALERHCVAGCCEWDAFDFSRASVREAVVGVPEADVAALARALATAASGVRALGEQGVAEVRSSRLGASAAAAAYADLLDDLAGHLADHLDDGRAGPHPTGAPGSG